MDKLALGRAFSVFTLKWQLEFGGTYAQIGRRRRTEKRNKSLLVLAGYYDCSISDLLISPII